MSETKEGCFGEVYSKAFHKCWREETSNEKAEERRAERDELMSKTLENEGGLGQGGWVGLQQEAVHLIL